MINMARCEKHGVVAHHTINVCKLCTAENGGAQPASAQQLKPKMPSEAEVIAAINSGFITLREQAIYRLGVEWCYKYFAQHFER